MRVDPRILAITLLVVVLSSGSRWSGVRDVTFMSIANEHGERLDSAFAGVSPNSVFLRLIVAKRPQPRCGAKPNALSQLIEFFQPTAHAQNGCQPSDGYAQTCVDHYMLEEVDNCLQ